MLVQMKSLDSTTGLEKTYLASGMKRKLKSAIELCLQSVRIGQITNTEQCS